MLGSSHGITFNVSCRGRQAPGGCQRQSAQTGGRNFTPGEVRGGRTSPAQLCCGGAGPSGRQPALEGVTQRQSCIPTKHIQNNVVSLELKHEFILNLRIWERAK